MPPASEATAAGLTFREQMTGPFAMGVTDPHEGARIGRRTGWRLTLHATVTIGDMAAFVAAPQHPGTLAGEIEFPGIVERLPFRDGVFQLFAPSKDPDLTLFRYEAPVVLNERPHYLAGRKNVRDDPGFDLWPDTTTLDVRLHDGPDAGGEVVGAGILRLGVTDLVRLLLSMRVLHPASPAQAAGALAAFAGLFARNLVESYVLRPRARARRTG
ncbi:hypothetical protein ACFQE5_15975 [Pseudonocardia hispaniensis]|uniref:Cholesterol oxidase n=1 Tax=Pseudonocardia hispaniensis TaxID=904933 RepID=A0ABW1J5C3_9PSEU